MSSKHILPREHGTWAMLLIPLAVGCGLARRFGPAEWLVSIAILMFFLAQNQIMNALRQRFLAHPDPAAMIRIRSLIFFFGAVGGAAVIPLFVVYHRYGLIGFGLIAALLTLATMILVRKKMDRSLLGQILASAGLSLSAPVAFYVGSGVVHGRIVGLWLVNFLFFLGGVFYVQMKIDALAQKNRFQTLFDRIRFAGKTLILETVIIGVLLLVLHASSFSFGVLLAFVPTALQAMAGTFRLNRPAQLKRIGILSTIHSILFAVIFIWAASI